MKGVKFKLHNAGHLRNWLKTANDCHGGRAVAQAAKFGESAIPILIEGFEAKGGIAWLVCIDALAKIGKPAVPALLEVLDNGAYDSRTYAAMALGKMKEKSAVPVFAQRIRNANAMERLDTEGDVLLEATGLVEALGKIRAEEAIRVLVECLGSPHRKIRERASETLVEIGVVAIPGLVRGLKSENRDERERVVNILRYTKGFKEPAGLELKKVILDEKEEGLFRARALEVLGSYWGDFEVGMPFALSYIADIAFCPGICKMLEKRGPRTGGDLHIVRGAMAEFKNKYGKMGPDGHNYVKGARALKSLYSSWARGLEKMANAIINDKSFHVPKVKKLGGGTDGMERILRVKRVMRPGRA